MWIDELAKSYLEDRPDRERVVNNNGDRCCPLRIGIWDPFQLACIHAFFQTRVTNYLLSGVTLQLSHRIHVWYIYLHLPHKLAKCR